MLNACGALFNVYLMLVHTTTAHDFDHPRFYEVSIAQEYSFHRRGYLVKSKLG